MRKINLILILLFCFSLVLSACSGNDEPVEKIPLVSIENFEEDTKEVILIYGKRIDKLEPLSDEEKKKVEEYFNNYDENPRLDDKQEGIVMDIQYLFFQYFRYNQFKNSDNPDYIETRNKSIEACFDQLEEFEEDGYKIK